jgi:hypothetical protein
MSAAKSDDSSPSALTALNSSWLVIICRHLIQWIFAVSQSSRDRRETRRRDRSGASLPEPLDQIFPRAEQ